MRALFIETEKGRKKRRKWILYSVDFVESFPMSTFVAKISVDTDESEPSKISRKLEFHTAVSRVMQGTPFTLKTLVGAGLLGLH